MSGEKQSYYINKEAHVSKQLRMSITLLSLENVNTIKRIVLGIKLIHFVVERPLYSIGR